MGRDKATMPCPGAPGMTMVEHTVAVLGTRCDPMFVVAAPAQHLPPLVAVMLRDAEPGAGPLSATACGLRAAAAAGAEWAFVSAVDMPYLDGDVVERLAGLRGADADVVLPWDGRDHYLAGVYRTALADRIEALVGSGERSMRSLVATAATVRLAFDAGSRALTNLNAPGLS
jgi:molybdopterin-guanine dinucleotide biosynthesis protein A